MLSLLDALMEERNVTKVGERLGITQSAVSHGLQRLRQLLGDPLFVRGATGLKPTARMRSIAPGLREGLARMRAAIENPGFDPSISERQFTIAAVSYACATLVPAVIERIVAAAPHVRLRIIPLPADLADALSTGEIDLAIGSFEDIPARLVAEPLLVEDSVWVVAAGHPLAGSRPPLDVLLALPQLRINAAADVAGVRGRVVVGGLKQIITINYDEHFVATEGNRPNVVATVYDVRTALATAARTQLAALVPRRIAREVSSHRGLTIIEPLERSRTIDVSLMRHREAGQEVGRRWLRDIILAAAEQVS